MDNLTQLDENELKSLPKMSADAGFRAKSALDAYTSTLSGVSGSVFEKGDNSTAQAVIDSLNSEVKKIADSMSEVDSMLDSLLELIDHEILAKEDSLAKELWGN